nr:unnamed protein product [Callosobruchus analis]
MLVKFEEFQEKDGGWALLEILHLKVNINEYNPIGVRKSYTSSKDKNIPANPCRLKCCEKLSEDDKLQIFQRFYSLQTKDEQNIFLQGLIQVLNIKQRRPRQSEKHKPKSVSYKFYVFKGSAKTEVCLKSFLSLYAVTHKRVRRIESLAQQGKSHKDLREKQPSANAFSEEVRELVREHIQSFPVKLSHYSGQERKYLDRDLTICTMHRIFSRNFNFSFGRPQVDVCSTYELLNNKIKNKTLNDTAKRRAVAELMVHKRRCKKFYSKVKSETENHADSKNVLALAFDYVQNIQFPKSPVDDIFYYHSQKTANEICTFLTDYLKEIKKNHKEIHLFSDNCWGQNKNHTVIRMLLSLTDCGLFEKIIHYYPVRAHSFLPCDRDFTLVKKNLRKYDRLSTVHQITELIVTSCTKKYDKFSVKEVDTTDVVDFSKWWPKFYKKNFRFSCFKYNSELKDLPPFIGSSKSVINIKNIDPYCFLWSVVCALYPAPKDKNVSRVTSYPRFIKVLNLGNIKFPITLKDIPNFEQLNGLAINVFTVIDEECLMDRRQVKTQQNFITTSKHNVYTVSQKKVALSPYNDKRMVSYLYTDTLPRSHLQKGQRRELGIPSPINTDTPQDPVGIRSTGSTVPKELLGEYIRGIIHCGQCKTFASAKNP